MPALLEMNTSPAEPEQVDRKPAMRFQHPSGSRPLDGYTIKRGVGRGGFGEVYFAVSDAGKEVALKLIRRNLEVELRGVTHCLNLKHPNLIDIYDIRTDEHDDRWVVMEYVSGASLEDVIDRHPDGMPRDMALHWFEGICAGVAYLHDHGIVHRDLKPANIFLDEGRVKIGDYGLSKFISCSRRSGQTESVGTVHYMAPEIANGRYGREIDAYALGIILYEMLTGRVPFEGESVGEVLMKHLTAEPDLNKLEEPYRSVVRGAMAKDPERRIDNAAEMMNMLRGVPRTPMAEQTYTATAAFIPENGDGAQAPLFANVSPLPRPGGGRSPDRPVEPWRDFFHRRPDPVWAALVKVGQRLVDDVGFRSWRPAARFLSVAAVIAGLVAFAPVTFVISVMLTFWYLCYRALRVLIQVTTHPPASMEPYGRPTPVQRFVSPTPTPAPRTEQAVAADKVSAAADTASSPFAVTMPHEPQRRKWRRRGQATWRYAAYDELASQPIRHRAATLLASMLAAAGIAPVTALLACMLVTTDNFNAPLFLWTAIIGTIASWAIIVPAQVAEGRVEDQAPLRFTMLLLGALVGMVAWGVAQLLYLELPASRDFGLSPRDTFSASMLNWGNDTLNQQYNSGLVQLPIAMYTAFFAFLFVIVRWWRQAEWIRTTRVSLWSMGWSGAVAGVVSLFWWFPQPLGVICAAVISFTVQLASPWLAPRRRKQMAQAVA